MIAGDSHSNRNVFQGGNIALDHSPKVAAPLAKDPTSQRLRRFTFPALSDVPAHRCSPACLGQTRREGHDWTLLPLRIQERPLGVALLHCRRCGLANASRRRRLAVPR